MDSSAVYRPTTYLKISLHPRQNVKKKGVPTPSAPRFECELIECGLECGLNAGWVQRWIRRRVLRRPTRGGLWDCRVALWWDPAGATAVTSASGWVLLAPRGGPTTSSANTPLFDDVAVPPLTWSSTWPEGPFHLNVIGLPDLGLLVEFRRLHVRSWIHGHVSVSRREGGFWNGIKWISIKWFNGFTNQYQQWVCHRIYLTGIKIVKKVEEKQETVKQANSVKKSGLKFVQSFQS